ncbi:MAG: response regulator [Planctomycetes bacterium]|nr:response regulator [Planctomycetota bacterium]
MLCEDDDAVRRVTERILRRFGYAVLSAAHGAEALEVLERHGGLIDMLITDVVMPGMSGPELARAFQSRFRGTRILYVSGYTADHLDPADQLGDRVEFLAKPYSSEALIQRITRILGR